MVIDDLATNEVSFFVCLFVFCVCVCGGMASFNFGFFMVFKCP